MNERTNDRDEGVRLLENQLASTRSWAERSMRELFTELAGDLRAHHRRANRAERRLARSEELLEEARLQAERARRRAAQARARARAAERELAQLRSSTAWRVGRAVLAVPRRARGLLATSRHDE
jgi:hypothetical protein